MTITPGPHFYGVIPGLRSNGMDVYVYKVTNKETGEVVKQIPSEKDIAQIERLAKLRNKLFPTEN